jgi:hypothetical protein
MCVWPFALTFVWKNFQFTPDIQADVQASFLIQQRYYCLYVPRNGKGSLMFSGNPKYQILCKHTQKFSSPDSQAEVSMLIDIVLQLIEASMPLTD